LDDKDNDIVELAGLSISPRQLTLKTRDIMQPNAVGAGNKSKRRIFIVKLPRGDREMGRGFGIHKEASHKTLGSHAPEEQAHSANRRQEDGNTIQFLPTALQNGTGHLPEIHVVHQASLAQNNAATSIWGHRMRHDREDAFKELIRKSEIPLNLNDATGVIKVQVIFRVGKSIGESLWQ
jgi:hypothetical protein